MTVSSGVSYLFVAPRWLTFEATIIRLSSFTIQFSMLDRVSVTGRVLEFVALTSTLSSMGPIGRYPSTKTIAQKMNLPVANTHQSPCLAKPGNITSPVAVGLCCLCLQSIRPSEALQHPVH